MSHLAYPAAILIGIIAGMCDISCSVTSLSNVSQWLLYILIVQVGLGLGVRPDIKDIFRSFDMKILMLPLLTIIGTLLFTYIASLIMRYGNSRDVLAIGSGFGYYSLSSVLIAKTKTVSSGAETATVLASTALITNIIREIIALISCRILAIKGLNYTAISVAGINSMDVCLPMITAKRSSHHIVTAALIHGIILEISVPLLIAIFCT